MPDQWFTSTPNGKRWRSLYNPASIGENFAADANTSTLEIETYWDDSVELIEDFFGTVTYSGGKFSRGNPLQSGYYSNHYLRLMTMKGFYPDAPNDECITVDYETGWPQITGKAQYRCEFGTLPYDVLNDDQFVYNDPESTGEPLRGDQIYVGTGDTYTPPESLRYFSLTRRYMPEARKTPSAGFVVYHDGVTGSAFDSFVVQEVGFIPTFQIELIGKCWRWPLENFPHTYIENALGTVNSKPVKLRGKTYPVGTLLYKGLAREISDYLWMDRKRYTDIEHVWGYRPQGHNKHRLNDGRWQPLVVKGTEPTATPAPPGNTLVPMFPEYDHRNLFQPEPAAT